MTSLSCHDIMSACSCAHERSCTRYVVVVKCCGADRVQHDSAGVVGGDGDGERNTAWQNARQCQQVKRCLDRLSPATGTCPYVV